MVYYKLTYLNMSYNDEDELNNVDEFSGDAIEDTEDEILDEDDAFDTSLEDDTIDDEESEDLLDGEFMGMNEDEY